MATLRQIQEHEVRMLKDIAKVCDDNNIPYYLAGGTLLGAVRHKGFIPWDDDIDINLKIQDIKKLKRCYKKQLPKHYFWQDAWTDRNYKMVWSRLRDTDTKICTIKPNGEKHMENGLFIDIIPLLYAAKSEKWFERQIRVIYLWSYCVRNQNIIRRGNYSSFLNRIYRILRELIVYRCGGQFFYWLMQVMQNKQSKKLIVLDVWFYDDYRESNLLGIKRFLVEEEWLKPTEYEFENEKFKSFSDYHNYLTNHYGDDYMTPVKGRIHIDPELSEVPTID